MDWIMFTDDDKIKCRTCGKVIERGIANVSFHWANCEGIAIMQDVNKIDKLKFDSTDKMDIIKSLFNVHQ